MSFILVTPTFLWILDVADLHPHPSLIWVLPASLSKAWVFTVSGSLLQSRKRQQKKRLKVRLRLRRPM